MARATCCPQAPLQRAALLLLLLLLMTSGQLATEPYCLCARKMRAVHPRSIQSMRVLAPGSHCDHTEVIAMLKDGREACLDTESPMVQKTIHKLLNRKHPEATWMALTGLEHTD